MSDATPGAGFACPDLTVFCRLDVPRELFARHMDPPAAELHLLAQDPFALDAAVAALRRFGLVKANEQLLTVHRLLQQVVRDSLDPTTKAARVGVVVRLLEQELPFGGYLDPGLWPVCAQLLPHALAATEHAEQLKVEPLMTARLLENAGDYLLGRTRYADARRLHERAMAIYEAHLGADHPDTARSLSNLANVLREQGDLSDARRLHERALVIYEGRLGADHPDAGWVLNNLARVLHAQGDLADARRLLERPWPSTRGGGIPTISRSPGPSTTLPALSAIKAIWPALGFCTSAPWSSGRRTWATTPTPPAASTTSLTSWPNRVTWLPPTASRSAPLPSTRRT